MASMRSWLSLVMTSQGSMPSFAPRHGGHVDVHADTAAPGRLARRARQSGPAEVLDPDHELAIEEFETGLDQPLLLEGIADLDARALGVIGLDVVAGEAGRGQNDHAANAVTPGAAPEEDSQVARARRNPEHQPIGRQRAHAQHIDQGVLGVTRVEGQLSPTVGTPTEFPSPRCH